MLAHSAPWHASRCSRFRSLLVGAVAWVVFLITAAALPLMWGNRRWSIINDRWGWILCHWRWGTADFRHRSNFWLPSYYPNFLRVSVDCSREEFYDEWVPRPSGSGHLIRGTDVEGVLIISRALKWSNGRWMKVDVASRLFFLLTAKFRPVISAVQCVQQLLSVQQWRCSCTAFCHNLVSCNWPMSGDHT